MADACVLLLGDHEALLGEWSDRLRALGFRPVRAKTTPDALTLAEERGYSFRVALVEAEIPAFDLGAALESLRRHSSANHLRFPRLRRRARCGRTRTAASRGDRARAVGAGRRESTALRAQPRLRERPRPAPSLRASRADRLAYAHLRRRTQEAGLGVLTLRSRLLHRHPASLHARREGSRRAAPAVGARAHRRYGRLRQCSRQLAEEQPADRNGSSLRRGDPRAAAAPPGPDRRSR